MVFKLYLHYDGPPEFTKVHKLPDDSTITVSDVLGDFIAAYNRKNSGTSALTASHLLLKNERGAAVDLKKAVIGLLKSGSNLTVSDASRQSAAAECSVTSLPRQLRGALAESSGSLPDTNDAGTQESGRPYIHRPKANRTPAIPAPAQDPALVKPFLEKAADAESKQHYRIAATIYQQVINSSPQNYEGLVRLIRLWRKVNRNTQALALARDAARFYPRCPVIREMLADSLRDAGSIQDALREYDAAVVMAKEQTNKKLQEHAQVRMASMLYGTGDPKYKEVAASLVMNILEADESQPEALFEYAVIAYDRGMIADATRVLLRLMVVGKDDAKIKLQLSRCLQHSEGMDLLAKELSCSKGQEAVFAFLATAVKDQGAVPICIKLFRMASEAAPENASYALNLMHAHELLQDYQAAIQVALSFCQTTGLTLGGGFEFEQAAALLDGLPSLTKGMGKEWLELEPWIPPQADFPTESDRAAAATVACETSPLAEEAASNPKSKPSQVEYSENQLDALALVFTAVKVLYLGGAITRAACLVQAVKAARKASKRPLHTTRIRNEAAYFACISQLLLKHPPPPTLTHLRPLFLCGDSHTLSGAWHTLKLRGEIRLIMPLLVTGCKIWHLRAAGRFFPKMAWLSTLQALPDGSQLVFMFGEIDCREGLLLAVDKLKYDSMEDAMGVLADIYAGVLLDLARNRRFEIFVHPVPSVLNETRHVVKPFNDVLRRTVMKVAKQPEAGGRLHWLDHFSKLLTPDALRLNPSLQFDGTHMNPGYVKIMEDAMASL